MTAKPFILALIHCNRTSLYSDKSVHKFACYFTMYFLQSVHLPVRYYCVYALFINLARFGYLALVLRCPYCCRQVILPLLRRLALSDPVLPRGFATLTLVRRIAWPASPCLVPRTLHSVFLTPFRTIIVHTRAGIGRI
jgi:hypothetical protein